MGGKKDKKKKKDKDKKSKKEKQDKKSKSGKKLKKKDRKEKAGKLSEKTAKEFKINRSGCPDEEAHVEVNEPTEWLRFRYSRIEGRGAFARKAIPSGTQVIQYVGRMIDKEESEQLCQDFNEYIFSINDEIDLDGNVDWNPARLINHSCDPNCSAEQHGETIWIVADRDIQPDEEVSFNYGYSLENYREYPCNCRSQHCVGYIVADEYHELVRRENGLPPLKKNATDEQR